MRMQELNESIYNAKPIFNNLENREAAQNLQVFIQENCQSWLAQAGNLIVYRGLNLPSDINYSYIKKVRRNRLPKDSTAAWHRLFNNIITAFGGVANRSNSVFASGDISQAEVYGEIYVVFPISDFNYTWSPIYSDLTSEFYEEEGWTEYFELSDDERGKLRAKYAPEANKILGITDIIKFTSNPENRKTYFELLNDLVDENFSRLPTKVTTNILNYDIKAMKKDKMFIVDKNLKDAINSNNEIALSCDTVLLIEADFYHRYMSH
jgi:hypothetical protein